MTLARQITATPPRITANKSISRMRSRSQVARQHAEPALHFERRLRTRRLLRRAPTPVRHLDRDRDRPLVAFLSKLLRIRFVQVDHFSRYRHRTGIQGGVLKSAHRSEPRDGHDIARRDRDPVHRRQRSRDMRTVFQQKTRLKTRWNTVRLYLHSFVLDAQDPDLDA